VQQNHKISAPGQTTLIRTTPTARITEHSDLETKIIISNQMQCFFGQQTENEKQNEQNSIRKLLFYDLVSDIGLKNMVGLIRHICFMK
jgi:hypothetical protein